MTPARRLVDLYCDQLAAISSWHARRHAEEAEAAAALARGATYQQQEELARRLVVLHREHDGIVRCTHRQLCTSVRPLYITAARRAVLSGGSPWFRRAVTAALEDDGVEVVARPLDTANAVGVAVAEQPDVTVVASSPSIISREQAIRELRSLAPHTLVAAEAVQDHQVAALVEAGAQITFTPRIGPIELAHLCADELMGPLSAEA